MVDLFRERIFTLFLLLTFSSFIQLSAQTDSLTINSRNTSEAETKPVDYPSARYKSRFLTSLPESVKETSGLLFFNGEIWTINDSGNQPEMYQLDSANGNVLRTVVVHNAVNTDWESITQDDSNVYIGDFGNNAGNRTDLRILKIAKTDLLNPSNDTIGAQYITFILTDQTNFMQAYHQTDFDCEAFFYNNDSLHLFSKNWLDLHTKHYVLPVDAGNYTARLAERFNADGLITDASINSTGNIVLLGYKKTKGRKYRCFTWLLSDYDGSEYFGGDKRRIELGSALHLGQAEGIVLKNDNTGWISSESIILGCIHKPAKLFSFDFGSYY
jgi:hypothetical protein